MNTNPTSSFETGSQGTLRFLASRVAALTHFRLTHSPSNDSSMNVLAPFLLPSTLSEPKMPYPLPQEFQDALSSSPGQRFVVMTCGIAGVSPTSPSAFFPTHQTTGSGKSTLAKSICTTYPNFQRLSVDSYIFSHYGLAGIDCPIPQYDKYQSEAQAELKSQFREILKEGERDVVLDFSFWNREFRDEWRHVIREETEDGKVKVMLMFFDATEDVLWRRIEERRRHAAEKGREADDATTVTRAMLSRYVRGFKRPEEDEEGVIVVKVE